MSESDVDHEEDCTENDAECRQTADYDVDDGIDGFQLMDNMRPITRWTSTCTQPTRYVSN